MWGRYTPHHCKVLLDFAEWELNKQGHQQLEGTKHKAHVDFVLLLFQYVAEDLRGSGPLTSSQGFNRRCRFVWPTSEGRTLRAAYSWREG